MAIFKTCCCCCRIRSGCLVAAVFFMAVASVDLANTVTSLKEEFKPVLCSSAVADVVMIIMSLALMVGVLLANKWLCLAWITYAAVFMATGTIIAIVHVATEAVEFENILATLNTLNNGNGTSYNVDVLREGKAMELGILMAVYIVAAIPMCILLLVVISHYQNLRDGVEDDESLPMPYELTEYNGLSKQRRKQERMIREDAPSNMHGKHGYYRPRPEFPRSITLRPEVQTAAYFTPEVGPRLEVQTAEVNPGRGLSLEVPGSAVKAPEGPNESPVSQHSEGAQTCTEVVVFTDTAKTASEPTPDVYSPESLSPDDLGMTSSGCVPTCTPKCLQQEALLPNQPTRTDTTNKP
ncbi:PREDICTED: uncharacterized protein LOC109468409 [Branchiostoma belcheri]|uniref:Uncharacterized protein LOC109468409 n=1 Tax=Branchiostoma belcheri TaxID=7741 RepID=A0A6P4YKI9_BRABE|nr:PREDICTED: uncharacterized protein LOC109468409 [Branchiostoma belcheri]